MARIFITGSAGGLGRAAAQTLLGAGHEVIVSRSTTSASLAKVPSRGNPLRDVRWWRP
jgi:nucleoside-diphosphate-sugar epimerase